MRVQGHGHYDLMEILRSELATVARADQQAATLAQELERSVAEARRVAAAAMPTIPLADLRQGSAKNSVENKTETSIVKTSDTPKKAAKMAQINAFIATNPKMSTPLTNPEEITIKDAQKINKEALMTETLARVYLEQKKYKKALQAYKILSLKYPEKNSFFASQIKVVQKLIKENL